MPFTITQNITFTVICVCVIPLLALGFRAIGLASKLPAPSKTLCLYVLLLDIIVVAGTAVEPWLIYYTTYRRDIGDLGVVLINTIVAMMTIERTCALKCPMSYISYCSNFKITVSFATTALILEIVVYALCRLLPCYVFNEYPGEFRDEVHLINYIMVIQSIICIVSAVCFAMVIYQMSKNKRTHTRRITRMGLPMTYARNVTEAHTSAILFPLLPTMLFTTLFSLLSVHRCELNNSKLLTWCALVSRIIMFLVHGCVFNLWFDECRLHLLTMFSPLGISVRQRANNMRIQVYNIVVSSSFTESPRQTNFTGQRYPGRAKYACQKSTISMTSSTKRSTATLEKFNDLVDIEETDTSI